MIGLYLKETIDNSNMNTHSLSELNGILRMSEAHALKCTIDEGITYRVYEEQIRKGYLTVSATTKMVKKAISLYGLFLRRMFKEGFSLILDCRKFYHCPASAIIVDGEIIPIRVKERLNLKTIKEGSWERKAFIPLGELVIEIYGGTGWNATRTLVKPEDGKWEDIIEEVIPYLHKAAGRIRKERLAQEELRRKNEEEARIRKEHIRAIQDRATAVKQILEDVWLFERAELIKRYCDIAEQLTKSEKYKAKIQIAREVADWINPTSDYEDELLSERYSVTDFLD